MRWLDYLQDEHPIVFYTLVCFGTLVVMFIEAFVIYALFILVISMC